MVFGGYDFSRAEKMPVMLGFSPRAYGTFSVPICGMSARKVKRTSLSAPVAQLDRALASEARGREFESPRARHFLQSVLSKYCSLYPYGSRFDQNQVLRALEMSDFLQKLSLSLGITC